MCEFLAFVNVHDYLDLESPWTWINYLWHTFKQHINMNAYMMICLCLNIILHQFSFPLQYVFRMTIFPLHGLYSNGPQDLASPARPFILSPKLLDGMFFVRVLTVKIPFNHNYFYRPSTSWTSEFQAYTNLHHTLTLNDLEPYSTT